MPGPQVTETVSREGVLALFSRHNLGVLRTETESTPNGPIFWRLFLDQNGTLLHFQERAGRLTFATLEHYMTSDPALVETTCAVLEKAGWEIDSENVG